MIDDNDLIISETEGYIEDPVVLKYAVCQLIDGLITSIIIDEPTDIALEGTQFIQTPDSSGNDALVGGMWNGITFVPPKVCAVCQLIDGLIINIIVAKPTDTPPEGTQLIEILEANRHEVKIGGTWDGINFLFESN